MGDHLSRHPIIWISFERFKNKALRILAKYMNRFWSKTCDWLDLIGKSILHKLKIKFWNEQGTSYQERQNLLKLAIFQWIIREKKKYSKIQSL